MNEYRALPARNQALSGAEAEAVEFAPLDERQHAIVIDACLMKSGSTGHFGAASHFESS
ncbi:hypothetical protein [Bradyrhizobium diazoefficiens]|uniref:hypothetical protein n=1 Tax=Bradyrhizobium diazoefficiens TaxID=1355477 RepID=UPI00271502D0|nr:hypothetical protein [Bradyrhizobium diazoefficiens]WLA53202.1 hypothetical protein QIH81_21685 [Bradyrhizobium diazoefficiens]